MNILATFNSNETEPTEYTDRQTVKAVILNENDEVLLFAGGELPGGGVEEGETNEETLVRELQEEIGATVIIEKEIGNAIAYRDGLSLKYIFTGYKCSFVSFSNPTTVHEEEKGKHAVWVPRLEAITKIENEIKDIKNKGIEFYGIEDYQRKVFNREVAVVFLKEVIK